EVAEVLVQSGRVQIVIAGGLLLDPDRVGAELAVRRVLDPEIAVFHEAPEPALVDGVLGEARAEQLLGLAHLDPPVARWAPVTTRWGRERELGAANWNVGPPGLAVNRPGSRCTTAAMASIPVQCCGIACSTSSSRNASTTRVMRRSSRPLRWKPPMTACTRGTPVKRTAFLQMPTMPRCEHEVTTTSPRSRTLATRVCSPMKVSWTSSPPSSSTRRFQG